jgi:hypothetical protein
MDVYIAGSGKLATELLTAWPPASSTRVRPWTGDPGQPERAVVVHAGSGRLLPELGAFCERTGSVLVELATGSALEGQVPRFPVVLCPNTNILMLKFMCMLERSGALFRGADIRLTESHQASKSSVPGTAVAMAQSLGVAVADIVSVRHPAEQTERLGLAPQHLARHAFHRIDITDGACQLRLETRVLGDTPYVSGVSQIVHAVQRQALESRVYDVMAFIENGWL